jgi:hypothetical protein
LRMRWRKAQEIEQQNDCEDPPLGSTCHDIYISADTGGDLSRDAQKSLSI